MSKNNKTKTENGHERRVAVYYCQVSDDSHAKLFLFFISLWQDPVHLLSLEEKHIRIAYEKLQPGVNYTVDVKVKLVPGIVYEGPWSEWSSTVNWRTAGTPAEPEGRGALCRPTFCLKLNLNCWGRSSFVCLYVCALIIHTNISERGSVTFCYHHLSVHLCVTYSFTGINQSWWYALLPSGFVVLLLLLGCLQKPWVL